MNILEAMRDPNLFAPWFRQPDTWIAWRAFLTGLFGLPLESDACAVFRECTGRDKPPDDGVSEAWLVVGRRGGKSFILALVAVFLSCFKDWTPYLQRGERATVMVIAADRKQARVIMRYVRALLTDIPMLARLVERESAETIDLVDRVTIEIHTMNFRSVRGYTVVAALLDEMAFWRSEDSANPDVEILAALRPALATVPGSMLLCASSPYARRGALYQTFRQHYGSNGRVLVWRAPTQVMNPTIPKDVIDAAYEEDPSRAMSEYGAEFRTDIESFVSREAVEACVVPNRLELSSAPGITYFGFVDPSGGSRDSMTLAIAHRDGDLGVLDAVREIQPPFSPEAVVGEFAAMLKLYGVGVVTGDRYAGEWPREQFRKLGIAYDLATKPKSDLYRDLLPMLNSGRVELLDQPRLISQLIGLERRTARSGRDSIDHAPGGHDDVVNAVAGVLGMVGEPVQKRRMMKVYA